MLKRDELQKVIESKFRDRLSAYGMEGVEVTEERDHDGDPVIYALVKYSKPLSDARIKQLAHEELDESLDVMRYLTDLGDQRFLHIRHRFAELGKS